MKIIKATDYRYRKVVQVCLNDTEPKWVHIVGTQRRDASGKPETDMAGNPILIASPNVPPGETGDTEEAKATGKTPCYNCKSNWKIVEYIFEGKWLTLKDAELLEEVQRRTASLKPAQSITALVGKDI